MRAPSVGGGAEKRALAHGTGDDLAWAVKRSFGAVIGIEIDKNLAARALSNAPDCICLCMDAGDYDFPPAPAVIYLYNPFQGKTMDRLPGTSRDRCAKSRVTFGSST
jgi:hypothetical protein